MQAEVVTIGTELLLGQIVDTNAAYISQLMADVGVSVLYRANVGDNAERAAQVLSDALSRADIVITTGGLGPTVDDVTRDAVARAVGKPLVLHEELLAQIEGMFTRWGRKMSPSNRVQAMLPEGCIPVPNPVGTAPGFIVERGGHVMISLPGVPSEMTHLMDHAVMPFLHDRFGLRGIIKLRTLRVSGMGESVLGERIADLMAESNPSVGTMAHTGQVDVRVAAKADSLAEADQLIAGMETRVRERLGDFIFGVDKDTLEGVAIKKLQAGDSTIAVLETNTGGSIAHRLTGAAGGLASVRGGWVVTSEEMAGRLFGLSGVPLVSAEAALLAAEWVRRAAGATWGIAIMGTLGADEHLYGRNTGECWITMIGPRTVAPEKFPYGGVTPQSRQWISNRALDIIRRNA